MILEREQWHLGYASLLRECRGSSLQNDGAPENLNGIPPTSSSQVGRALLLVHPDTDAMATARILSYMLRADGVPYQMRPCLGWERLKSVLGKVGVLPPPSTNDIEDENNEGDDEEERSNYIENETDIRAVVLMNMGANRNLSKLFRQINNNNNNGASQLQYSSTQDSFGMSGPYSSNLGGYGTRRNIKCYVFDCHRPYHLSNIHAGKNVVLFNDRPFEDDEIPSDGDNLSGDESSSSSSSDDDDDDDDESGGEGRKGNESDEDSEGEQEFELEDEDEGEKNKSEEESEDNDDEEEEEGERGAKRQKKTRFEDDEDDADDLNPADDEGQEGASSSSGGGRERGSARRDDDDGLQDSDEEDEDGMNKKRNDDQQNPLDTTAVTADMTMLDETFETSTELDQSQDQTQAQTQDGEAIPVTSFRELHRQRRNRIRLHYSSGSYHGSPSSWTAYTLCRQLRFGDTPDLLWLACVGVTDAYLHGRLDVAGYGALTVDLKSHVGRLFPNELVDRVGRAVYAEELEAESASLNDNGSRAWTQIGLSENGRILSQNEYKFMLLRHTSLWDSLLHSNFVASKLQVWKSSGRQRLMELLAKMGFPLDQCRQPWAFVGPGMKRRLGERMEDVSEVRS